MSTTINGTTAVGVADDVFTLYTPVTTTTTSTSVTASQIKMQYVAPSTTARAWWRTVR